MAAPPNPSLSFFSHFTGGASAFQPESLSPVSVERPSRPGPWNCGQSAAVVIPARANREKKGRIRFIGREGAKARVDRQSRNGGDLRDPGSRDGAAIESPRRYRLAHPVAQTESGSRSRRPPRSDSGIRLRRDGRSRPRGRGSIPNQSPGWQPKQSSPS